MLVYEVDCLPLFIAGFLRDRKFEVTVGGSYSKLAEQKRA